MPQEFRPVNFLVAALIAACVLLAWPRSSSADQAPFWESPVGLTPGLPNNQIRMLSETVNIEVRERGNDVVAVVNAQFDMLNRGPDVTIKVGFPAFTDAVISGDRSTGAPGGEWTFSPVLFSADKVSNFRIWTDEAEYRTAEIATPDTPYGFGWYLWEMPYPSGRTVRVYVAYEQLLGSIDEYHERLWFQPMYVLRTGALWDGTIGEATITMTAPDGGGLIGGPELFGYVSEAGAVETTPSAREVLGADGAAEATDTRIVWRLYDFEPTRDVGATYVVARAWQAIRAAEVAMASGAPAADDYLRGAQWALRLTDTWGAHGRPLVIANRYAPRAREWATQAVAMAPENWATWEALGDSHHWSAMPLRKHHGELECWPAAGAAAYQRAIGLGSSTASDKLEELFAASDHREYERLPDTVLCPPDSGPGPAVLAVRRAIKGGNQAWADAVGPRADASDYPRYFDGRWLRLLTDEVEALRARGEYRSASLQSLTFRSISFPAPDAAVVETTEEWMDQTYRTNQSVVRDVSGRLHQHYELRLRDGRWKIVDATIVRETPPRQS